MDVLGDFITESLDHARCEFVLGILSRGVLHHALFFRKLLIPTERDLPN